MIALMMALIGCGETSPETLVDELRVLASVATPPEVRPGETFTYESYAANPDDEAIESLTWVCTNLGEGCLEAGGGALSLHTGTHDGIAPSWERPLSVSAGMAPILIETGPLAASQVWTLTCTVGTCPLIAEVGASDGTAGWSDELADQLANPLDWMSELPMEGVSLAYQVLTASLSDSPHQNPSLEPDADNPTELSRGTAFELAFAVDGVFSDQAQLYAYVSDGGFKNLNTFIEPGETVTIKGTTPESGESIRAWIILVDGFGGVGVWTSEFSLN